MTSLATEIKNLWDNYPKAPKALIASKADRDAAIQTFLTNLQTSAKEDDKAIKAFVYAVSAVIFDQFNEGKAAETARLTLATDLVNAASQTPSIWETYRKHAVDSLTTASSGSIGVNEVAAHYQLDNGLLTTSAANELRYVTLLEDHIRDHLVKDDDVPMTPPRDFVHHLLYLYLYGSRNHYDTVMAPFESIRSTPRVSPLLQDEWNLLCAFPKDRFMTADVYYSLFQPIRAAVDAFIKAQTGTNSSLGSVPPLVGSQPPPRVNVSPIAIPNPSPSVIPVAAAAPPATVQLTPKQKTLKDEMDRLKNDVDLHEMELGFFESNLVKYQQELAALAGQPLEKADQFNQKISAEKEFKPDTHYLVVMKAHVDENAQIQTDASNAGTPVLDQASALQKIYNDTKDMYDDVNKGIKSRAAKANADLVSLKTQAAAAVNAAVTNLINSFISQMKSLRDDSKNETNDAKILRDQASVEYKTIAGTDLRYHTKDQLLVEKKRMERFKPGIKLKSSHISSNGNIAAKLYAKISDLKAAHPVSYTISNPTALANADVLKQEIASFKAQVDQYIQDVDNWIADVSNVTNTHLNIEAAKRPFTSPPPDPKKFKDDRVDQCNVWYHMFDADRLARSDAHRLAQLEARPNQPWAINFESISDVIRVLEAAVKTGRSNKMMDLKDKANFYKMAENLIIATCEELKMAPPQPNTLDEKMLLFVATGASLHDGVQWAYANDQITAWKFLRLTQIVNTRADPNTKQIKIAGNDMNLLTQSRHVPTSQSVKAPKFVRIEEAY